MFNDHGQTNALMLVTILFLLCTVILVAHSQIETTPEEDHKFEAQYLTTIPINCGTNLVDEGFKKCFNINAPYFIYNPNISVSNCKPVIKMYSDGAINQEGACQVYDKNNETTTKAVTECVYEQLKRSVNVASGRYTIEQALVRSRDIVTGCNDDPAYVFPRPEDSNPEGQNPPGESDPLNPKNE